VSSETQLTLPLLKLITDPKKTTGTLYSDSSIVLHFDKFSRMIVDDFPDNKEVSPEIEDSTVEESSFVPSPAKKKVISVKKPAKYLQ
jgi:hypothetical protein